MNQNPTHLLIPLLIAACPISAQAALVSFTGLSGAGGTFSSSVTGAPINPVTVSPVSGTGTGLIFVAEGPDGRIFRNEDMAPAAMGATISGTISLATPEEFTISTSSGVSNMNGNDSLSFIALGATTGFAWNIVNIANSNIIVSSTHFPNDTVTIRGTGDFAEFSLSPNQPVSSFQFTNTVQVGGGLNSSRFDLDVSVIPEAGTILSSLFGLGGGLARRRRAG